MTATPTTSGEAPTRFRWDRLTVASALGYCVLAGGLGVGVVLGELRQQFHINGVVAALHGSTFGIGLLAAGLWGVRLVDRIGRRQVLRAATGAITAGIVLFCVGPSWPLTLLGTAFSGTGAALIVMVMPGLISDHHGEHRATAFAAVNGVPMGAGLTYSLVIGATLTAGGSWRPPYLIITLCFVVALVIVATPVPVPEGAREGTFSLAPFTERDVFVPWLHIINAVLTEFTIGIWAVTYLHEVGKASAGSAAVYASVFGVTMFVSRLLLAKVVAVLGEWTVPVSFVIIGAGAAMMCFAPGIAPKTLGLAVAGFGGGSLYPLTVDRFYSRVGHRLDSVAMGAYCALASGVAVTLGPLALGVAADSFTLRWAILVVPALAAIGAVTQRPDPAA